MRPENEIHIGQGTVCFALTLTLLCGMLNNSSNARREVLAITGSGRSSSICSYKGFSHCLIKKFELVCQQSFVFAFAGLVSQWLLTHVVKASPDPRCPQPSCCSAGADEGACWRHGLWTVSYCCALGGAADCYRWGEDSPGHDLVVHAAHSGVQCRHLCQAHETCGYWSYIVNAPQVPENLRGQCFLKSSSASSRAERAHPFVVSGHRLCEHFGEGLSFTSAQGRLGLQIPAWRTSVSANKASMTGMLPGSGNEDWFREAAKVLDEVGFAA